VHRVADVTRVAEQLALGEVPGPRDGGDLLQDGLRQPTEQPDLTERGKDPRLFR
jgi:hypothetical protein